MDERITVGLVIRAIAVSFGAWALLAWAIVSR